MDEPDRGLPRGRTDPTLTDMPEIRTSPAVNAPNPSATAPSRPWTRLGRGAATVAILSYLAMVIAPPLAGPAPSSALAARIIQPLRPFVGALYLGHGYRFFAPDPGPGHAIRWSMRMADGSTLSGTLPDPAVDRPRLLYHRRFMIAEKIAGLVPTADAPEEVRREAKPQWQPLVMGVAGQLLRRHGGSEVELVMVEFDLPTPEESIAGRVAADVETPLGLYTLAASNPPRQRLPLSRDLR
jgi:hypothetical protein